MRRSLCLLSLVLALPLQAEEKVVNLYSWADYVAPQTLQRFERETGYKVRYDTFDTTEVLETKLLTGGSGYDVVVPSSTVLARALKANALQPFDPQAMPGYADHVRFIDKKLCESCAQKTCISMCSGQAIAASADGLPAFEREKCVHCGACLWNCAHSPDGEHGNIEFVAGSGGLHSAEN